MPPMCIDCQHHRLGQFLKNHLCARNATRIPDLVTGEPDDYPRESCYQARSEHGFIDRILGRQTKCGPDGDYFKPKLKVVPIAQAPVPSK